MYLCWKLEIVSFKNYTMIFMCIVYGISLLWTWLKKKKSKKTICVCVYLQFHIIIFVFVVTRMFSNFFPFCCVWWSYFFLLFHFHLSSSVQMSAISFSLLNGDGSLVIDVSVAPYSYSCGKYLAYLNFSTLDTLCF